MTPNLNEIETYSLLLRSAYETITRNVAFIRANPDAEPDESYNVIYQAGNAAQTAAEKILGQLQLPYDDPIGF